LLPVEQAGRTPERLCRDALAGNFTTTGCRATIQIINHRRFAAIAVINDEAHGLIDTQ
jgi:hypothetical protein